jgi:3-isopropylmalate/(R)-2-methylmalate dehydratase large subunit
MEMEQGERKTAFQKIVESHLLRTLADGRLVLKLDKVFCHEITTPNAILDAQARGCDVVFDPNRVKALIDHVSPAKDTLSAVQGKIMRDWSRKHDVEFLDIGRNGVCHAIIPEKGWILPGEVAIMGDSHTCTHGALGAFAAGVGSTDLETGIMTGLWICPPQKVIRVNFVGTLPMNVFSKDLVLTLINKIGVNGATNAVLEFGGPVIEEMSMDARLTITNMAVEAGATSGMMPVDQTTLAYIWPAIKHLYNNPSASMAVTDVFIKDNTGCQMALWDFGKFNSDPGVEYDQVIEIDVTDMKPVVTQNYSPGDVVPVSELEGKAIDQVYIGSCTNGRIEDLRIAAMVFELSGQSVAVRCIINPATPEIWKQAKNEGLFEIFEDAGCCVTNPSCGACLGLSCGVLAPGEVCVSTTNRNFPGRMGLNGMVHLASPATAAISAIRGCISVFDESLMQPENLQITTNEIARKTCRPEPWTKRLKTGIDYKSLLAERVNTTPVFYGKVAYLFDDDVDTDQIIPGKYLTETDKAEMGRHCMEDANLSAEGLERIFQSQILVTGRNFGCGSSREHAPWALEAAGIRCVVAKSFARIFENNMFANGLLCIQLDEETYNRLAKEAPKEIVISVKESRISWGGEDWGGDFPFKISEHQKTLIENGGSVGVMLKLAADLQAEGKI